MTDISISLAATHDGWFREPLIKHADVALRLWWRHLQRQRPFVVDAMEWVAAGTLAVALVIVELVATA